MDWKKLRPPTRRPVILAPSSDGLWRGDTVKSRGGGFANVTFAASRKHPCICTCRAFHATLLRGWSCSRLHGSSTHGEDVQKHTIVDRFIFMCVFICSLTIKVKRSAAGTCLWGAIFISDDKIHTIIILRLISTPMITVILLNIFQGLPLGLAD